MKMKKQMMILLLIGTFALGGCGSAQANRETQGTEPQKAAEAVEIPDSMKISYDSIVVSVLSKEWTAADSEERYTFTKEATGDLSGEPFTYTCGLDEDGRIFLQMVMAESEETKNYCVTTDTTGYGLYLEPTDGGERIYIIQSNVRILDVQEERVQGLLGSWTDKSDNCYTFREDGTLTIEGSSGKNEGTYSVAETEEGTILKMLFGGNELDLTYEFDEEGEWLELCAPGSDTVHRWTKQS